MESNGLDRWFSGKGFYDGFPREYSDFISDMTKDVKKTPKTDEDVDDSRLLDDEDAEQE